MEKTVVELFAGVGGFRCGFNEIKKFDFESGRAIEKHNWDFVWANQWEPSTKTQAAYNCYIERFGKDSCCCEDIKVVNDKQLEGKINIPKHSVLVGGFPCQDYSVARSLSNEQGIEGKKGVLWWQITRFLDINNPPFILLENVDRLLRSPSNQRGRDFGIMLKSLYDRGYAVEWRVINAAEYGFPQKRRRVFIFAYHRSTQFFKKMDKLHSDDIVESEGFFAKTFPIKSKVYKGDSNIAYKSLGADGILHVSDNFEFHFFNSGIMFNGDIFTYKVEPMYSGEYTKLGDILQKAFIDDKYLVPKEKIDKWKELKGSKKKERFKPNGEPYCYSEGKVAFPDHLNVPARTMLTSEGTTNRSSHIIDVDKKKDFYRILTPIETERIQMFPDNWTNIDDKSMTERRRYFMMGNALVVGVVERLGKYLERIVEDED